MEKRSPAKSFQDLIVWQKAHAFVLQVYTATRAFPKEELYGLTSQFRRAAVSIPANIAEGFRKQSEADKARFLNISEGSLEECRYYLILGKRQAEPFLAPGVGSEVVFVEPLAKEYPYGTQDRCRGVRGVAEAMGTV
jgi:four helix bundle protein